jgi:hypothetical protein
MMTKREIVIFLLLATSLLSGCGACVLPFIGGAEVIPIAGGSYQGYSVWKGRE